MKTKLYYTFLALCIAICTIGFSSCSKNEDKYANIYNYGFSKNGFVGGDEDAYSADVELVYQTVYKEFKDDMGVLYGDQDKCDQEAITRFNKACDRVQLKGGWYGKFNYSLYKTIDDETKQPTVIIADRVFEVAE